jgi:5-methylcytosine-specific restriction enzyme A
VRAGLDPTHTHYWRTRVRPAILARDGHLCQIRGPKCQLDATHVDHIVPWRAGGAWYHEDNLRAACAACNVGRARHGPKDAGRVRPSREW